MHDISNLGLHSRSPPKIRCVLYVLSFPYTVLSVAFSQETILRIHRDLGQLCGILPLTGIKESLRKTTTICFLVKFYDHV